ncbi:MAG: phage antirepressor KilAC domain-containing protein [Prevotellaceae bacterium]|nr:phage antirepressor KilAC domain-containing protein [Prevotellaceae bacterium]
MDTKVQIFNNSQFGEVRVAEIEGKVMFAASEVAKCLGYENPSEAVLYHCKSGNIEKCYIAHENGLGGVNVNFIPEGEVYRLIIHSKLPTAEKFQDWVFDEVLPSIRKHGGYMVSNPDETPEEIMARALLIARETIERSKKRLVEAEKIIEVQAPKVEYYEKVLSSDNLMTITEIAKNYGWSGVSLNGILHGAGVQYKKGRHWFITAKYQDKDYVRFIPVYQYEKNGVQIVKNEMKWTETGRKFIHELLIENGLINRQKSLML